MSEIVELSRSDCRDRSHLAVFATRIGIERQCVASGDKESSEPNDYLGTIEYLFNAFRTTPS